MIVVLFYCMRPVFSAQTLDRVASEVHWLWGQKRELWLLCFFFCFVVFLPPPHPPLLHLSSLHACLTELVGQCLRSGLVFSVTSVCLGWMLFNEKKKGLQYFWVGSKCLLTSPFVCVSRCRGRPQIDHYKGRGWSRAAPALPPRYLIKERQEICKYVYIVKESLCIFEFSNLRQVTLFYYYYNYDWNYYYYYDYYYIIFYFILFLLLWFFFFFTTPFLLFMPVDTGRFYNKYTASHSQNSNVISNRSSFFMLLVCFHFIRQVIL